MGWGKCLSRMAQNSEKKPRGKGKPFPPGVSGNPGGRPRRGTSWADVFRKIGDLTPIEAAEMCMGLAANYRSLGDKVTLKEAVALRIFLDMISVPHMGELETVMTRADGPVTQTINVNWREQLEQLGYGDLFEQLVQFFASRLPGADGGGSDTRGEAAGGSQSTG